MSRTLLCTADVRTWPEPDRPVFFLGEWCRMHAIADRWKGMDYEILPYHWLDVAERHKDFRHLDAVFEQVLSQLSELLNRIHQRQYTLRYWRIVVGSWLRYFIGVLYDRFRSLESALETGGVDCIPVLSCGPWQRVPRDFNDFFHEVLTDHGNQHIYKVLCTIMAPDLVRIVGQEDFRREEKGSWIREWGSVAAFAATSSLSSLSRRRLVVSLAYCKMGELAKLGRKLGQVLPAPFPRVRSRTFAIDESLRAQLTLDDGGDSFSRVVARTIKEFFPSAYLEGYAQMSRLAERIFPRNVRLIIDDNFLHGHEAYKFWAASTVEQGAKLAVCQHGGFYGSGEWIGHEVHEKSISDVYLNWGWEETACSKTVPSIVLSRLESRENLSIPSATRIAWIGNIFPRYAYYQVSMPTAHEVLGYIEDQIRFYRSLSPELAAQLWLRPFPKDWEWGFTERLIDAGFDERNICPRKISLTEQLQASRIGVYTANTTVHLEMFAMNIPTLLYWNRDIWRTRPEAEPYYEALRRAEILHDSPESAAAKLTKVYDDPWSWWSSNPVQDAVHSYLDRFGFATNDWVGEWKSRLKHAGLWE